MFLFGTSLTFALTLVSPSNPTSQIVRYMFMSIDGKHYGAKGIP